MLNKVILIGHVGADPIVKKLENGTVVANFSIATDESYKDKNGEKIKETYWHDITAWGKLAELVEKLIEHFQSFEVENYQLFGVSNGQKVKLFWIED